MMRGDVQVALGRRRLADADRLVGELEVRGVGVGGGIDARRLDAQLAAGADDPQGDLAAVGDEDSENIVAVRGAGFEVRDGRSSSVLDLRPRTLNP